MKKPAGTKTPLTLIPRTNGRIVWEDLRFNLLFLFFMAFDSYCAFDFYKHSFESWEMVGRGNKALLVVGGLCAMGLPFMLWWTAYVYWGWKKGEVEKRELDKKMKI